MAINLNQAFLVPAWHGVPHCCAILLPLWHWEGIPEQLPPKSGGKHEPDKGPGGPFIIFTLQLPFDWQVVWHCILPLPEPPLLELENELENELLGLLPVLNLDPTPNVPRTSLRSFTLPLLELFLRDCIIFYCRYKMFKN